MYHIRESVPDPETFLQLRIDAGLTPYSREAVERGLPNTVFGVVATTRETGETVGMARLVGDGGTVYHLCDMAVRPAHQRQGVGSRLMEAIVAYLDREAPPQAYVNLMADVDGFYERWGFERTAPSSTGMARWTTDDGDR